MHIRPYQPNDCVSLVQLFSAAIHSLAAPYYDTAQRNAWAAAATQLDQWRQRFSELNTLVAEQDQRLLGFIGYALDGHIDLLYVAPECARCGVASALYAQAEAALRAAAVAELFTEASLAAQAFFVSRGFVVVEQQQVERNGVLLQRWEMRKALE